MLIDKDTKRELEDRLTKLLEKMNMMEESFDYQNFADSCSNCFYVIEGKRIWYARKHEQIYRLATKMLAEINKGQEDQ